MSGDLKSTFTFASNISNLSWQTPKDLGGGNSIAQPAMAAGFQNKLWAVHRGNDAFPYFTSFDTVSGWGSWQKIPPNNTAYAPALAVFNGKLWCMYRGYTIDEYLWIMSYDGQNWSQAYPIPGNTSGAAPALAVFDGGDGEKLWCVYRGLNDQHLWVISSASGDYQDWSGAQTIPNTTSAAGVGLATYNGLLCCVYRGLNDNNLWICYNDSFYNQSWTNSQTIPGHTSNYQPSLCTVDGTNALLCVYGSGGSDSQVNYTYNNTSDVLTGWSPAKPAGAIQSTCGMGIASMNNIVYGTFPSA